jgi:methylmalonyl-CoA mutase N-terminal domain/subunit
MEHAADQQQHDPRSATSCMLRFYAGSGGNTLTVEEPLNNIGRVAVEVMVSALGGPGHSRLFLR